MDYALVQDDEKPGQVSVDCSHDSALRLKMSVCECLELSGWGSFPLPFVFSDLGFRIIMRRYDWE